MMALLLPFCSCGKAHHGAANPELFRSLSGIKPLNAVMLELGKADHGAANPRLFRSLSEFILCFPRHSEAEWMLRTDLAK